MERMGAVPAGAVVERELEGATGRRMSESQPDIAGPSGPGRMPWSGSAGGTVLCLLVPLPAGGRLIENHWKRGVPDYGPERYAP